MFVERAIFSLLVRHLPDSGASSHGGSPRRVLHLEDNDGFAHLVSELLESTEFDVQRARSLGEAEALLAQHDFEAALIDLSVSDASGLQAVMAVRGLAPALPVVVLTGSASHSAAVKAMLLGAQDWLEKAEVSFARLDSSIRLAVARQNAQAQLSWKASHDELTGLTNRAAAVEHLDRAMARALRHDFWPAVLFCDLDGFKAVNDAYGHGCGDRVLARTASRLVAAVRPEDVVARWGGDEFVVVAEHIVSEVQGRAVACRIQAAVAEPLTVDQRRLELSVTIGMVMAEGQRSAHWAIDAADRAMLAAKQDGSGLCLARGDTAVAPSVGRTAHSGRGLAPA